MTSMAGRTHRAGSRCPRGGELAERLVRSLDRAVPRRSPAKMYDKEVPRRESTNHWLRPPSGARANTDVLQKSVEADRILYEFW